MRLKEKSIIITGASDGIGKAMVSQFAAAGANLVIGARREALLTEIANEASAKFGVQVVPLAGDVQKEAYAKQLVDAAVKEFGGLDAAVNNAGTLGQAGPVTDMTASSWAEVIDTNLTACFYGAKHQLPPMVERGAGSVVFTSSFVGPMMGFPGTAAYGASKAGLVGLARCLATEYGPAGVRVNAMLPGGTETKMVDDFSGGEDMSDMISNFHALKRMASADEIAKAALFLVSVDSSFVTGSAMVVDGGNSINKI